MFTATPGTHVQRFYIEHINNVQVKCCVTELRHRGQPEQESISAGSRSWGGSSVNVTPGAIPRHHGRKKAFEAFFWWLHILLWWLHVLKLVVLSCSSCSWESVMKLFGNAHI